MDDGVGLVIRFIGAVITFVIWGVIAINISDARAPHTAETFGFSNVHVKDSSIWFPGLRGCGVGDLKIWYVVGSDPNGVRRHFIVCGGLFKANTLRVR